jgi:hypothetical protein
LDEVGRLLKVVYDLSREGTLATVAAISSKAPFSYTPRALKWGMKLGKIYVANPWSDDDKHYQIR